MPDLNAPAYDLSNLIPPALTPEQEAAAQQPLQMMNEVELQSAVFAVASVLSMFFGQEIREAIMFLTEKFHEELTNTVNADA